MKIFILLICGIYFSHAIQTNPLFATVRTSQASYVVAFLQKASDRKDPHIKYPPLGLYKYTRDSESNIFIQVWVQQRK